MDENGQILRSAKDAMNSQELTTRFHDGEVKSQVHKT
jgi:exonuclease VII large subunit